jgi:6-phosphofructokinase 1
MPGKYINKEGNHVTEAFRRYAMPLVGSLPTMQHIAAPKVPKILSK